MKGMGCINMKICFINFNKVVSFKLILLLLSTGNPQNNFIYFKMLVSYQIAICTLLNIRSQKTICRRFKVLLIKKNLNVMNNL